MSRRRQGTVARSVVFTHPREPISISKNNDRFEAGRLRGQGRDDLFDRSSRTLGNRSPSRCTVIAKIDAFLRLVGPALPVRLVLRMTAWITTVTALNSLAEAARASHVIGSSGLDVLYGSRGRCSYFAV